jgi:hypothetical protein
MTGEVHWPRCSPGWRGLLERRREARLRTSNKLPILR